MKGGLTKNTAKCAPLGKTLPRIGVQLNKGLERWKNNPCWVNKARIGLKKEKPNKGET